MTWSVPHVSSRCRSVTVSSRSVASVCSTRRTSIGWIRFAKSVTVSPERRASKVSSQFGFTLVVLLINQTLSLCLFISLFRRSIWLNPLFFPSYPSHRSSGSCRANCFRNNEFLKCVDLLLYSNQKNELNDIADSLYGS